MTTSDLRTASIRTARMQVRVLNPTRSDPAFDRLRESSATLVPGTGNILARVLVAGEAPGEQEDRCGLPFVGPSGVLLDEFLEIAGLNRPDLWTTNVAKYRPVTNSGMNRRPSWAEMEAARGYFRKEISIVSPRLVILCGRVAFNAIRPGSISEWHGKAFDAKAPGRTYFVVAHPSACLRNPEWEAWTRADFALVPGLLG